MEEINNKLMEKLLKYAQNIEDFTKGEVPLYIQELLEFKYVENLAGYFVPVLGFGTILVILLILSYVFRKQLKESWEEYDGLLASFTATFIIIFLTGTVVSVFCYGKLIDAYKIKTAPKVYLIDYLKGNTK